MPKEILISPKTAKDRLEELGYTPLVVKRILSEVEEGFPRGSHMIRALIEISMGQEPASLEKVKARIEKEDKEKGTRKIYPFV